MNYIYIQAVCMLGILSLILLQIWDSVLRVMDLSTLGGIICFGYIIGCIILQITSDWYFEVAKHPVTEDHIDSAHPNP